MSLRDYYEKWLVQSFEDSNLDYSKEQLKDIIDSLMIYIENESMATGRDCITNPMETELRNIKTKHKTELKYTETQHENIIKEKDYYIQRLNSRIYDLENELRKLQ